MKKLSLCLAILITNCSLITSGKCGDGIIDLNKEEECDDGNNDSGDGCTEKTCKLEGGVCGNGVTEAGETCDDSNTTSGDGCDSLCQTEAPECGNGVVEAGEDCDDGNNSNTDDCVDCQDAACGDGFIQAGVETCEPPSAGACNAQCQLECQSPADCQDTDLCTENEDCLGNVCVNTAVDPDDGNQCTSDSCNAATGVSNSPQTNGFACDIDAGRDICLGGVCVDSDCGDNFIDVGGSEQCDDGNQTNTDACPNDCTPEVCGDGVTEGAEQCDDGGTTPDDGCDQNCQNEGTVVNCAGNAGALFNALSAAASGSVLTVQNGGQCGLAQPALLVDNKDITVNAVGAQAILGSNLTIQGTSNVTFTNIRFAAIVIVQETASTIFQDSLFNASSTSPVLLVSGSADVAVLGSTLTNAGNGGTVRCDQSNARFVVDRSTFTGSTGDSVVDLLGGCDGIIANSLFVNNATTDAIQVFDSQLDLVFSTFHNSGSNNGVGRADGNGSAFILDSVVGDDSGSDPVESTSSGNILATDTFIQGEAEFGITNQDPNLDGAFNIPAGNGVRGQGNPTPITLFFNPAEIVPGLNIFTHDFNNLARPQGATDPGAFEEAQ